MAWKYFVKQSKTFQNSSLFRRDLVDLSREALNIIAGFYYQTMLRAFHWNQTERVHIFGHKLVKTLSDLNLLLSSDENFLLGKWIGEAKRWGKTETERIQMEFNAKNQITLWGPNGQILDYARKQWAGVMNDYYKPRWSLFVAKLLESLMTGNRFDQRKYEQEIFVATEKPFGDARSSYPDRPVGDSIKIAKQLYKYYINDCKAIKLME